MKILERALMKFLRRSEIKVEISGFEMEDLSEALHWELSERLDTISCYAFDPEMTDAEKIAAIQNCFEQDDIDF